MKAAIQTCVTSAIAVITLVAFMHGSGCQSKTASPKPEPAACTSDDVVKLASDLRNFCESDAITLSSFTRFIEQDRRGEWTIDNGVGSFDHLVVEYLSTKWKDVRIRTKIVDIAPDEITKENDGRVFDMSIILSNDKSEKAVINIMVDGDVRW